MVNMNKVNEKNTNWILSMLYVLRDRVSILISSYESIQGANCQLAHWSFKYNEIINDIEEVCIYRRYHECLLEGDDGFEEIKFKDVCNYNFTDDDLKELGFEERR